MFSLPNVVRCLLLACMLAEGAWSCEHPYKQGMQMHLLALHEVAFLVLRICEALCHNARAKQLQCSLGCGAPGFEEACWLQSLVLLWSLDGFQVRSLALHEEASLPRGLCLREALCHNGAAQQLQ